MPLEGDADPALSVAATLPSAHSKVKMSETETALSDELHPRPRRRSSTARRPTSFEKSALHPPAGGYDATLAPGDSGGPDSPRGRVGTPAEVERKSESPQKDRAAALTEGWIHLPPPGSLGDLATE
jgi:hypothetical protein